MKFPSKRPLVAIAILLFSLVPAIANAGGSWDFDGLQPGEFVVHNQKVPIRVVLIGFEEGQVNEDDLMSWLPATYQPLVRYPQFYGLSGRDMGLEYEFKYRIIHKKRRFTNAFFEHLSEIGIEGDPTLYQTLYNDFNLNNVLEITGPVLYIDTAAVEEWLEEADRRDGKRGYTIYFVNWYGREDFRFHVYTKTDEPDPDTAFNFGETEETASISWGGTSSRSWFYDFSAGPEWNTVNWFVDAVDINGDGFEDYRMPNTWEYDDNGYRSPDALGFDMGLLARFVAINLLFTSSPLYDPLVTAPSPFGSKVAHIAMFEDDPASSGLDYLNKNMARAKWRELQPYYFWKTPVVQFDPIDEASKASLDIFAGNSLDGGCWEAYGSPFAQLFCHFDQNLPDYVPPYGKRDYVGEVFSFNSTPEGLGVQLGLLGYADDNWIDGTQSYSFVFGGDLYRDVGYGFTSTTIHELGHHIGLSHPHDGYDSEFNLDYGPGGSLWFAWVGDESDTVMSYLGVSNGFGEHNTDNMHRWEMAGYLNWANALAGDILASGKASSVTHALWLADRLAEDSIDAFNDWDYLRAVRKARIAYAILDSAAHHIGLESSSLAAARTALPASEVTHHSCRPKLLMERMLGPRMPVTQ